MTKKIILLLVFCSCICFANDYSNSNVNYNNIISTGLNSEVGKAIAPIIITEDNVEQICKIYIKRLHPNFDTSSLYLQNAVLKQNQWYVHFGQAIDGLKIINSKMKFRIFKNGNLLDVETNLFDNVLYESVDINDSNQIKLSILSDIELPNDTDLDFVFNGKYIYPIKKANTTIYKIIENVEVKNDIGTIGYGLYIDIKTGMILQKHNLIMNEEIKVKSSIYTSLNEPMQETTKFPHLKALISNTEYYADSNGTFNIPTDVNGLTATIDFSNITSTIDDIPDDFHKGPYIQYMRCREYVPETGQRTDFNINNDFVIKNNEILFESSDDEWIDSIYGFIATHYYHTLYMHNEFKKIDSTFDYLSRGLNFTFLIYNSQHTDSMYYSNASSGGSNITFYNIFTLSPRKFVQSPATLYHELGHSINRFLYQDFGSIWGMINGALNEGTADVHAAYLRNSSEMDYMPDRTLENNLKLGVNEQNQVHADGRIFSGAMWDFKKLTSLELMGELMHYTRFATPDGSTPKIAYTNWLKEMLLTDDDDGILTNLTPHFNEIIEAFYKHNITLSLYAQLNYIHEPVQDNNDTTNPYPVELTIPFVNQFLPFDIVWLLYSTNGKENPPIFMKKSNTEDGKYISSIPPQSKGTWVSYHFEVVDPYMNTSFLLNQYRSNYNFIVDFDTVYANYGFAEPNIKISAGNNSTTWRSDIPSEQSDTITVFAPITDVNDDDYCFMVTDHQQQEQHLGTATLIFPSIKMPSAKNCFIQLYYFYYLNVSSSTINYGTLDFSLSDNGGFSWLLKETIRWLDIYGNNDNDLWKKLTININERYQQFNDIGLRIRALRGSVDPNRTFSMAAYIDDVIYIVGDSTNSAIQNLELTDVNIFPNPSNTTSFISFNNLIDGNVEVILLDMLGRQIRTIYNGFIDAGEVSIAVDISTLNSGMYFTKIKQGANITTQKLVVN